MYALVRYVEIITDNRLHVISVEDILNFDPADEFDFDNKKTYTAEWHDEKDEANSGQYVIQILRLAVQKLVQELPGMNREHIGAHQPEPGAVVVAPLDPQLPAAPIQAPEAEPPAAPDAQPPIEEVPNFSPTADGRWGHCPQAYRLADPNEGFKVSFDNWFTLYGLVCTLKERGLLSVGTVRPSHLPHCSFKNDAALKKEGLGSFDVTTEPKNNVAAVKWYDKEPVHLVSSHVAVATTGQVERWSSISRATVIVERPDIVGEYNQFLGGEDLCDMLVEHYRCDIRGRRYYLLIMVHELHGHHAAPSVGGPSLASKSEKLAPSPQGTQERGQARLAPAFPWKEEQHACYHQGLAEAAAAPVGELGP
ncbi:hypothetical protein HPB47_015981 [Ixodes persulcatus]|uniref:Uncharacterized protein n=1 Tax=Ixodes persulcatus TaxID=34615 RepID=A0AC60QT99_IXOPE|nr:hypothetical protein HPB47_015981 [Ixodes persulcatus]